MQSLKLILISIFTTLHFGIVAQEISSRPTKPFHSIEVASGIDLFIKQGDSLSIIVDCDRLYINTIATDIEDSILVVKSHQPMRWGHSKSPKVYVIVKQIKSIIATNGADVYGSGILQAPNLTLATNGGSDIYVTVDCKKLRINASGGSSIKASGQTIDFKALVTEGSDLNAADLKASNCTVTTSGGSNAIVNASVSIVAEAMGNSDIGYFGKPPIKQFTEKGGSNIFRK